MDFDAPETTEGEGGRVTEPGLYHLLITTVRDGEGPKGGTIDGFSFEADALAANVGNVSGKSFGETVFAPDLSKAANVQAMAARKLAAFFIAANVMKPDQLGKKGISVDLGAAEGQQIIAKLRPQMNKNPGTGKYDVSSGFLEINYSDIYHVDDPAVKAVPKDKEYLDTIDAGHRHAADFFAYKAKKKTAGNKPQPKVDVDDLF